MNSPSINKTTPSHPNLTLPKFARNKNTKSEPNQSIQQIQPVTNTIPQIKRTPAKAIINGVIQLEETVPPSAKTPLIIPKIGIIKGTPTTPLHIISEENEQIHGSKDPFLDNLSKIDHIYPVDKNNTELQLDENPWLPPKIDGISDVKIAAITPIGTIAMVPTSDKRPPVTPRKLPATPGRHLTLRVIDENTGEVKIDPILTTTIYLDCTKQEDQDYYHVSNRMRKITANTTTLQKQYSTEFKPLINITGKVSYSQFEEALSIYENNQVYYQDRLDDHTLDLDSIRIGLTTLEHWFACIIEPKSQDDPDSWRERELSKLTKGITSYCDSDLYKYIQPLPPHIISFIQQCHVGLLKQ
jgi:hypothetical protein